MTPLAPCSRAVLLPLSLMALSLLSACGPTTPPSPVATLANERGCMACHGLVHTQVGPGFAQIAERYRGDIEAPARLAGKIRAGSVGNWGRLIMPPQTQATPEEARSLAGWVLSQPASP